jgi:hypothetical protein
MPRRVIKTFHGESARVPGSARLTIDRAYRSAVTLIWVCAGTPPSTTSMTHLHPGKQSPDSAASSRPAIQPPAAIQTLRGTRRKDRMEGALLNACARMARRVGPSTLVSLTLGIAGAAWTRVRPVIGLVLERDAGVGRLPACARALPGTYQARTGESAPSSSWSPAATGGQGREVQLARWFVVWKVPPGAGVAGRGTSVGMGVWEWTGKS